MVNRPPVPIAKLSTSKVFSVANVPFTVTVESTPPLTAPVTRPVRPSRARVLLSKITAPSIKPLFVMAMGAVALVMLNALVPPVIVPPTSLVMPPLMVEASTRKASTTASMVPLLVMAPLMSEPKATTKASPPAVMVPLLVMAPLLVILPKMSELMVEVEKYPHRSQSSSC